MRDYGRIRSRFWCDEEIAALESAPKLLACYLMSSAHGNAIGCFRLPVGYIAEDLREDPARIAANLLVLQDVGFILRDAETGWTLLPNHIKHNPIENPNVGRACEKLAAQVPDTFPHLAELLRSLEASPKNLPETLCEGLRKRVATVSEQIGNNKPKPKPNPKPDLSDANASSAADASPSPLPVIDPKRVIFGECLDWLAKAENKPPEKLRGFVGKLVSDYGEAAVIKAFQAGSRDPPAGSAVEFIVAILQANGGQRGRSGQGKTGFGNAFMAAESRRREASGS